MVKVHDDAENTGSDLNYCSTESLSCRVSKKHDQTETLSIKEEVELDIINWPAKVFMTKNRNITRLPVMKDPAHKLCLNKD